jgi:uncharacterized membrane protein
MSSEPFENSMSSSSHAMQSDATRGASAPNASAEYASPYTPYSEWSEPEAEQDVQPSRLQSHQLSNFLGWFSIGLGLAELIAPKALGRAIGVGDQTTILRALGVREITSGLGLLSQRGTAAWAWSRVGGDAMDLALLAAAARHADANPRRIAMAATAVVGVAALDLYASRRLQAEPVELNDEVITQSLAINSTPEALYTFWRNVENLPRFMTHLESVTVTGEQTSHWVAKAPGGSSVEWDAQIVRDDPNEGLSWETVEGSEIQHQGTVRFEPARSGRGTIVRVELRYAPPAGKVGVYLARALGEEPDVQIKDDLRRLKQLLETGEVATVLGQSSGRRTLLGRTTLGGRMQ